MTFNLSLMSIHQTLKVTPSMAAGVTNKLWEMSDMVKVLAAIMHRFDRFAAPSTAFARVRY
jgi:hypothetical protein